MPCKMSMLQPTEENEALGVVPLPQLAHLKSRGISRQWADNLAPVLPPTISHRKALAEIHRRRLPISYAPSPEVTTQILYSERPI